MEGKAIMEASAEAGERVRVFHFAAYDAPPPAVLLDGRVVFAAVSIR